VRRLDDRNLDRGQLLARAIYNERGEILLNTGVEVTERFVQLLLSRGISTVYVKEPGEEDVPPEDIVSERVRVAALTNIYKVFEVAARATADLQGKHPDQIVSELRRPGAAKPSPADAAAYERMFRSVENIVDEVLTADTLPGLNSLKSHDNYTFCHSVDVSITALLLGKKLFLSRDQLKALGMGCIMHDVGKSLIDLSILNKPGRLTDDEFARIKAHPSIGFELLKAQMAGDVLPKHVALQHHEHQSGDGYPRGLRGANKVARGASDQMDAGRIMLLAEIAAVADVYDALASDRSYRAGLAPEQIVEIMGGMRGTHLNAEVLDTFFSVLPRYPVGIDFTVTAGRYTGFRGVVLATNKQAIDRPRVRLVYDDRGTRLSTPEEIDLVDSPDTLISCVAEDVPVPA
jgi:HD-GYP domain-containing protein (c-di-GMP phosphodiesterase class II)